MRKIAMYSIVSILSALVLFRIPPYWSCFLGDKTKYDTNTFYYIIKEECLENKKGRVLQLQEFTDIETGDILVTDSTYCFFFRHGHAALVVDAEQGITLEAFGLGTESEYSSLSEWKSYPHVRVLRLEAPKEVRNRVAEYAEQSLKGIPYRLTSGMIDDKDMDGEYWGTQCAHLVWAAYEAYGYDLDGDGGWLVTPEDFTESKLLQTVPQEKNSVALESRNMN